MALLVAVLAAMAVWVLTLPGPGRNRTQPGLPWAAPAEPEPAGIPAALLQNLVHRLAPGRLGDNLVVSGLPWTLRQVLAAKAGAAALALLYAAGFFLYTRSPFFAALTLAAPLLGWMLPDAIVAARADTRRGAIARDLPNFVFTLAVLTEAGLHMVPALEWYCRQSRSTLAAYLRGLLQAVEMGEPLTVMLIHLAEHVEVPELTLLVGTLVQSLEKGGDGLARTLRNQAADAWDKRRRRAQALGHQASAKLFFPLFLLVTPAAILVAVAPGLYMFLRDFRF